MSRAKWTKEEENVEIGQVIDENLPPSHWAFGRVTETILSKGGLVRTVAVEVASKNHTKKGFQKKTTKLTRPVHKICIRPTESEYDLSLYNFPGDKTSNVRPNVVITETARQKFPWYKRSLSIRCILTLTIKCVQSWQCPNFLAKCILVQATKVCFVNHHLDLEAFQV